MFSIKYGKLKKYFLSSVMVGMQFRSFFKVFVKEKYEKLKFWN
jgi:hypothetical protein